LCQKEFKSIRKVVKNYFLLSFIFLYACSSKKVFQNNINNSLKSAKFSYEIFKLDPAPLLFGGDGTLRLGGLSGLHFESTSANKNKLIFTSHTDRGPNGDIEKKDTHPARRFAVPQFAPLLVKLELNTQKKSLKVLEQIPLLNKNGKFITGLPNLDPRSKRPDADEVPLDSKGKEVTIDPTGLDLEGLTKDERKNLWMVEEYRPSILHFSSTHMLIDRFVPVDSNEKNKFFGKEVLPSSLRDRQLNRGFEAVAYDQKRIYAFLQSPLKKSLENEKTKKQIPIIEFDTQEKKVTNEFTYVLDSLEADKIGDAVALGNKKFLVVEQNSKTGDKSIHKIYKINLNKGPVAEKEFVINLAAMGLTQLEKIEGLAKVDARTLAIVTDNDFSIFKETETNLVLIHSSVDLF
jgi:hypothetical protein